MKVKRIRSWNLNADNLDEMVRFYSDVLGADEGGRHNVGGTEVARLRLGATGIGLFDASDGEMPEGLARFVAHQVGVLGRDLLAILDQLQHRLFTFHGAFRAGEPGDAARGAANHARGPDGRGEGGQTTQRALEKGLV